MKFLPRCFVLLALLLPPAALADTVRVAVASNFAALLEELAPEFERHSGHTLVMSAGATGNHYAQIVNGAPFDVFLAADAERPRLLEEAGRAVKGTSFTYAIGRLVLWSADPARVDAEGAVLRSGDFEHLALANPQLAPYGAAAREVLAGMGLWDQLQRRLVQGDNIAQTLQFVQSGNAELGFIAQAQLAGLEGGSRWLVPDTLHAPIEQQGVLVRDSAAARAFIAFLQEERATSRIRAAGYALP